MRSEVSASSQRSDDDSGDEMESDVGNTEQTSEGSDEDSDDAMDVTTTPKFILTVKKLMKNFRNGKLEERWYLKPP